VLSAAGESDRLVSPVQTRPPGGNVAEFAVLSLRGLGKQLERSVGSAAVMGHQDALGLLDHRLAGQGRAQVVDVLLGLGEVGCRRPDSWTKRAIGSSRVWGGALNGCVMAGYGAGNVSGGRCSGRVLARLLVGLRVRGSACAHSAVLCAQAGVVVLQAQHGGDAGEVQPVAEKLSDPA
jgi:hypothetical protein